MAQTGPTSPAAVIAFSSAVAAYGAFWIPQSYGVSIAATGGPDAALWCFIAFYVVCVALTWWYYVRRHAEVRC
jgi:NNP family nitrate/nitrite transporter-like MFS transporter